MHKEYILLNGFRKAKKGFTAGFHVPLNACDRTLPAIAELGQTLSGAAVAMTRDAPRIIR